MLSLSTAPIVLLAPIAFADSARSQAEIAQLRQSIAQLQRQLAKERIQEQSVTGELEQVERQLAELVKVRHAHLHELQDIKDAQTRLEQQRRDLEQQSIALRGDLVKLARANYMFGRQSGLKLLLNQHDPAQTTRSLAIFGYLSKARNRRIDAGKKLQMELTQTRIALDRQHRRLATLLQRIADNRAQLDAKRDQRARELRVIRQTMRRNEQQVVLYRRREKELARLLARLNHNRIRQSIPDGFVLGGIQQYKGDLGVPISGKIAARFGQRKAESGLKWEGLMFEADAGEEVVAIYSGQVVYSDWFRGYGQLMVIDHGDGYMSLYGHNRLLYADIGATVEAGENIGEAGTSGGLTNPGLYFEIRHNGEPRDPLDWFRI